MKLTVTSRDPIGMPVKHLRKEGYVPGVVYGKHLDQPIHVSMEKLPLLRAYEKTGGSTALEISGDGINQLVLFQNIQLHPVTDRLLHVEFLAVNKDEKVGAEVPLLLVGVSPFEKTGLGKVQLLKQAIHVTALPLDLPHDIKIDISVIDHEGQVLHVRDLLVSDKVHIDDDLDDAVVTSFAYSTEDEDAEEAEAAAAVSPADAEERKEKPAE